MPGLPSGAGFTPPRRRRGAGESLADLRAGRDRRGRVEQDDGARRVVGPHDEDFGEEGADLLRRKVDDRDHQAADQVARTVVRRDLGARALDAEWAEVDPELVSRTPRLGERARVGDDTDAHVDLLE